MPTSEEIVRSQFQKHLNHSNRRRYSVNFALDLDCDLAREGTIVPPEMCVARISAIGAKDGAYYHVTDRGVLYEDANGRAKRLFNFEEIASAAIVGSPSGVGGVLREIVKNRKYSEDIVVEKTDGLKVRLDCLGEAFDSLRRVIVLR